MLKVSRRHLALVGPTASGKTALGVELARRHGDIELVSADAMAVYRGLDVGTAKPTSKEREGLVWHLLDLVDACEEFSVAEFQRHAVSVLDAITSRAHRGLLIGGTGLYHRAVLDGLELPGRFPELHGSLAGEAGAEPEGLARLYGRLQELDPLAASRIEPGNARRILRALEVTIGSQRPFSSYGPGLSHYGESAFAIVGLRLSRSELAARIATRLDRQLDAGFLEEVRERHEAGPVSRTAVVALGYRELVDVLEARMTLEEAKVRIVAATVAFAKRQEAWFRRDPRVHWLDATREDLLDAVDSAFTSTSGVEG